MKSAKQEELCLQALACGFCGFGAGRRELGNGATHYYYFRRERLECTALAVSEFSHPTAVEFLLPPNKELLSVLDLLLQAGKQIVACFCWKRTPCWHTVSKLGAARF